MSNIQQSIKSSTRPNLSTTPSTYFIPKSDDLTPPNLTTSDGIASGFDFSTSSSSSSARLQRTEDQSGMDVDGDDLDADREGSDPAAGGSSTKGQNNFVWKLHRMLEGRKSDYLEWESDGTSFKIKDTEKFAEKEMKGVFKSQHYSSFVRQLNMYDFHKKNRAPRNNANAVRGSGQDTQYAIFEHSSGNFKRGHPENLSLIKRKAPDAAGANYTSGSARSQAVQMPNRSPTSLSTPIAPESVENLNRQIQSLTSKVQSLERDHHLLHTRLAEQEHQLRQFRGGGFSPPPGHSSYPDVHSYPALGFDGRRHSLSERTSLSDGSPGLQDTHRVHDLGSPTISRSTPYSDSLPAGSSGWTPMSLSSSHSSFDSSPTPQVGSYPLPYTAHNNHCRNPSQSSATSMQSTKSSVMTAASLSDARSHTVTTVPGTTNGNWSRQSL